MPSISHRHTRITRLVAGYRWTVPFDPNQTSWTNPISPLRPSSAADSGQLWSALVSSRLSSATFPEVFPFRVYLPILPQLGIQPLRIFLGLWIFNSVSYLACQCRRTLMTASFCQQFKFASEFSNVRILPQGLHCAIVSVLLAIWAVPRHIDARESISTSSSTPIQRIETSLRAVDGISMFTMAIPPQLSFHPLTFSRDHAS